MSGVRLHLAPASSNASINPCLGPAGAATLQMELSADHFVLTFGSGSQHAPVAKYAAAVSVGDTMMVLPPSAGAAQHSSPAQLTAATVCGVERVALQGLYAPFTLGGSIIVDGVVASSHSRWFADAAFAVLGLPVALLPQLYQTVLAPVRLLFWALGPQAYIEAYEQVDAELNIAELMSSAGSFVTVMRFVWLLMVAHAYAAAAACRMAFGLALSPIGAAAAAVAAATAVAAKSRAGAAAA